MLRFKPVLRKVWPGRGSFLTRCPRTHVVETPAGSPRRSGIRRLGCYGNATTVPNAVLPLTLPQNHPSMTIRRCAEAARLYGSDMFAIVNGTSCFGGSLSSVGGLPPPVPASQCSTGCSGSGSQKCGGPDSMSVFGIYGACCRASPCPVLVAMTGQSIRDACACMSDVLKRASALPLPCAATALRHVWCADRYNTIGSSPLTSNPCGSGRVPATVASAEDDVIIQNAMTVRSVCVKRLRPAGSVPCRRRPQTLHTV